MIGWEKRKERSRRYLEKNRVAIYQRRLEIYIPQAIQTIKEKMPDTVREYYEEFPFESYGEPIILRNLRKNGIRENRAEYQECYSAGMYAYLYSIHRCAFCGYTGQHVENYIKLLVAKAMIWGIVTARATQYLCKENDLRPVYLDSFEKNDRM